MYGYTADKDAYLTRLRRIEDQVRIGILTQVSAVTRETGP